MLYDYFSQMEEELDEIRRTTIAVSKLYDQNPFSYDILWCVLFIQKHFIYGQYSIEKLIHSKLYYDLLKFLKSQQKYLQSELFEDVDIRVYMMRLRLQKNTEYLINYLKTTLCKAAKYRIDRHVIKIPELQILMSKRYNFFNLIKKHKKNRVVDNAEHNTVQQLIKYAQIENTLMQLLRGYLIDLRENVLFLYPSNDKVGAKNFIPYFLEYIPSKTNLSVIFNNYKKIFF